jgi:hypothetical protein
MDWEKIKQSLKDGATISIEKIEEYTRLGKLKLDELGTKRKIERNYSDIGTRVFDLVEAGKGSDMQADLAVKKSIECVIQLKGELAQIQQKITELQELSRKGKEQSEDDSIGI